MVSSFCWHRACSETCSRSAIDSSGCARSERSAATALYLTALAHLEIANATAIAQLTPLAMTASAALFLGERVGIRRWTAIGIGFLAVLLIMRPGMQGFNAWSLLALGSVSFVVLRDLSSRACLRPSIRSPSP